MFTAILCGLPTTALAFEFGGQLALGRGYSPPLNPHSPRHAHTHTHTLLISLSCCQVCSVCVWGRIEWVIILGMETQEIFFFFFE